MTDPTKTKIQKDIAKRLLLEIGFEGAFDLLAGLLENEAEEDYCYPSDDRTMFGLFAIDLRNMAADMACIEGRQQAA